MWSTSAGGHLMKVVNLTGFTVLRNTAQHSRYNFSRVKTIIITYSECLKP
jgi:hypothetical protein